MTLAAHDQLIFTPAPGREHVGYLKSLHGSHVSVIPNDALELLHTGKLDPRLFDITLQLETNNDRLAYLPVILRHDSSPGVRASIATLFPSHAKEIASIHAVSVHADATTPLWRTIAAGSTSARLPDGVTKVWLDGVRKPTLDVSVPLIGAPVAWQQGLDGTGVTVAVLDTGIDASHPDLADRVIGEQNFTADDPVFGEDALDRVGHGTHVASTIAGTGAASGGRYRGVAPGAHLLDGKVCSEAAGGCFDSWMLAGMDWAATSGAKVINISIGGLDTPDLDPLEEAVNTLTAEHGVLFVIAAGNGGFDRTVTSPGSADAALTVAAFDKLDQLEDFSSRGPRVGDDAMKPEIAAPGGNIVAARSKDGEFGTPGDLYVELSGTSMATPHVAGSAAILAQQHPDASPAQLKATLMAAAKPNPTVETFAQGAGRVDVARAIRQHLTTEPASFSCGTQLYPHDDDIPVVTKVTYRNTGNDAVTLSLATHSLTSDGLPAPASMFTTSAASITVPANGSTSVDVTCDTRVDGPVGIIGAELTATGSGDVVVETPFGVVVEAEGYDLTVTQLDRSGNLNHNFYGYLVDVDHGLDPGGYFFIETNPQTFRVPRGTYLVTSSVIDFSDADGQSGTIMLAPPFELASDKLVTMDARDGKPVTVDVHDPDVQLIVAEERYAYVLGHNQWGGTEGFGTNLYAFEHDHLYSAQLGGGTFPALEFETIWLFGHLDAAKLLDGPYTYSLAYTDEGQLPTGFTRDVRRNQLARIDSDYASAAPGDLATETRVAFGTFNNPLLDLIDIVITPPFHLPAHLTNYVNTDDGIGWKSFVDTYTSDVQDLLEYEGGPARSYRPGERSHERWNYGVLQPRVGDPQYLATRQGSFITANTPMISDHEAHPGLFYDALTYRYSYSLTRNGVDVPGMGVFEVPPDLAHYRLTYGVSHERVDGVSSNVSVTWSFDSAEADNVTLPLSTIGFDPLLDDTNSAPAGLPWLVPLHIASQPGSDAPALHRPTVDVSYDDGETWQPSFVFELAGRTQALVIHPRKARWVSLRAHGQDGTGNAVDETVIRAYRLH